ncbi:hypothetical protein BDAP_002494 [Binucleata daphniae]
MTICLSFAASFSVPTLMQSSEESLEHVENNIELDVQGGCKLKLTEDEYHDHLIKKLDIIKEMEKGFLQNKTDAEKSEYLQNKYEKCAFSFLDPILLISKMQEQCADMEKRKIYSNAQNTFEDCKKDRTPTESNKINKD